MFGRSHRHHFQLNETQRNLPSSAFSLPPFLPSQKTVRAANLKLYVHNSEKAMLNMLLAKIHLIDPDVLVGHNISGFRYFVVSPRLVVVVVVVVVRKREGERLR